jgi:hypothetical protein
MPACSRTTTRQGSESTQCPTGAVGQEFTFPCLTAAVLCVPLVLSTVFASAAPADTRRGAGPQNARFDGRSIDLSKGWGNAQSCVVLTPEVRCFTTHAEADAFLGYDRASDQVARTVQAASCPSGWLCLYNGLDGTGRRLLFRDEYWNNLWEYDFARKASSVWNDQGCSDVEFSNHSKIRTSTESEKGGP